MPSRSYTDGAAGRPTAASAERALGVSAHAVAAPARRLGTLQRVEAAEGSQGCPSTQGPPRGGSTQHLRSPEGPRRPTPLTRTVRVRDAARGGGLHRWPRVTHGRRVPGPSREQAPGGAQAEAAAVRARSTPTLPALRPAARLRDCGACARARPPRGRGAPAPPLCPRARPWRLRGDLAPERGAGHRGRAPPDRLCGAGTAPARPPAARSVASLEEAPGRVTARGAAPGGEGRAQPAPSVWGLPPPPQVAHSGIGPGTLARALTLQDPRRKVQRSCRRELRSSWGVFLNAGPFVSKGSAVLSAV